MGYTGLGHHRASAAGAVRPDHRGGAEGEPPARHHHDRRSAELLHPLSVSAESHVTRGRACVTWSKSAWAAPPVGPTNSTTSTSCRRGAPGRRRTCRRPGSSTPTGSRSRSLAHPTDALVSPEFAIELGRLGGLGVLNGEGLIGRHADVEAKIAQVCRERPKPSRRAVDAAIRLLQQLHAAPLDPELLGAAVARIREAGVTTAVRVSPQNAAGADAGAGGGGHRPAGHPGHASSPPSGSPARSGEPLNLKTFISELDVPVVAGGVLDHRTALHLMRTGAAGVIVGYGSTAGVDHHRRGAGYQRADGHRDRRRRRRPPRLPRRDRRPLRARARRRRHPHLR